MAGFAYVNNTRFTPFSYQEMLAPLLMATQSHQAIEEAYGTLDSQANAVGSLADEANDPVTYARYKNYETSLREQADALAKNGLTPGSRQTLMNLRGRYSSDIVPIQNAIARREKLAEEQRKALLSNPTLMFQRNMNTLSYDSSLDRFLENPNYDYGNQYSGALLTQQVSTMAKNLAKELRGYGNGKRVDDFTKTFLQQYGYTSNQVLDAINNPESAKSQPILNAIVEQAIGSSGIANWADNDTMERAYGYAKQGLWDAIGQDRVNTYTDILAAKSATGTQQLSDLSINYNPIYSQNAIDEAARTYKDNLRRYDKYFTQDEEGNYVLNAKGRRALSESPADNVIMGGMPLGDQAFLTLMKSIGYTGDKAKVNELWNNYVNDPVSALSGYDARRYNEYYYKIDSSTDSKSWKDELARTAVNGQIDEVSFDGETETFKPTGKHMSLDELNDKDVSVIGINYSRYGDEGRGNTIMIKDKDGKVRRFKMNPGINTAVENAMAQYMEYAHMLEEVPEEGMDMKNASGQTVHITREQARAEHRRALNSAQSLLSQMAIENATKKQQYSPYGW